MVASSFKWMEGYLCHPNFIITENTPKNWQETDKRFQEACNFITGSMKTIETKLHKPEPDLTPELIKSGRNTLEAALGETYVDGVFKNLEDQHELTTIRNDLHTKR